MVMSIYDPLPTTHCPLPTAHCPLPTTHWLSFVWILCAAVSLGEPQITGLIEVPASPGRENVMAILYTGDGGWRATDHGLARTLAGQGIPTVAVNTLRYFWTRRTPEEAARDFERIVEHYLAAWKKQKVIVIGYSYGADVLPFILSRLSQSVVSHVELVALLAPTRTVDFEFHLMQWFLQYTPKTSKPVLPELEKLKGLRILTFCGDQDGEALCRYLPPGISKIVFLHGGHRFDKLYKVIAEDILKDTDCCSAPRP
jgi:type IV secretory pathway VirJ component